MKSYTDIEQSRKLAKILPLETADMYYSKHDTIHANTLYGSCDIQDFNIREYIPCWSLTALLSVLPLPSLIQDKVDDELFWQCSAYEEDGTLLCEIYDNNPIDACVEMIEKLHELKLLKL